MRQRNAVVEPDAVALCMRDSEPLSVALSDRVRERQHKQLGQRMHIRHVGCDSDAGRERVRQREHERLAYDERLCVDEQLGVAVALLERLRERLAHCVSQRLLDTLEFGVWLANGLHVRDMVVVSVAHALAQCERHAVRVDERLEFGQRLRKRHAARGERELKRDAKHVRVGDADDFNERHGMRQLERPALNVALGQRVAFGHAILLALDKRLHFRVALAQHDCKRIAFRQWVGLGLWLGQRNAEPVGHALGLGVQHGDILRERQPERLRERLWVAESLEHAHAKQLRVGSSERERHGLLKRERLAEP